MKKLLTLTAAILASFSLAWGAATNFHDFVAAGDTIIDLEGTGSTPSAKFTAVNNTDWASVSTSAKNATVKRIDPATGEGATSTSNTYGTKLSSSNKSIFKVTGVTSVSFYIGGASSRIGYLDVEPEGGTKIEKAAETEALSNTVDVITYALDKSKNYTLTAYASGDIFCYAVKFTVAPKCTSPANPLVLSSDAAETVYVGDEITLSATGGNGAGIGIAGTADEPLAGLTGTTWTATAGKHTFVATQVAYNGYCAQESELVFNVLEKTPVNAVTIAGPTSAFTGAELTYTATAENATAYQWLVDGVDANTNAATFVYTAVKGNHSIVCKARNEFNATDEWIASDPIALAVTENPVIVLWDKTPANRVGIINYGSSVSEGSVKIHNNTDNINGISLGSSYNYADKKFITIKPSIGYFEPGDTVFVATCWNNSDASKYGYVYLYNEDGTSLLFTSSKGINGRSEAGDPVVESFVLTSPADSLLIGRYGNTTTLVTTVKVTRPEDDGSSLLTVSKNVINLNVTATEPNPVEKVAIYGKNLTPGSYSIDGGGVAGLTVTPSEFIVGADGKLRDNITFSYVNDGDAAPYSTIRALTVDAVGGPKSIQITVNMSATHAKDYAYSLNIEQWILDNGVDNTAFAAVVGAANIEFSASSGLDSLQDVDKENRNEAFLGLKLKAKDITVKFWLEKGKALNVKFGNQPDAVNVMIGEAAQTPIAAKAGLYSLAADENNDRLITFTTTTGSTLVVKQIMIGEEIAEVTLPAQVSFKVTCEAAEHGSVKVGTKTEVWVAKTETVTLTVTPESGYKVADVQVNGVSLNAVESVYSFPMPAENVTVSASFVEDSGTAIDNTDAAVKATKVLRDGQVLILRDGKFFNALGVEVK